MRKSVHYTADFNEHVSIVGNLGGVVLFYYSVRNEMEWDIHVLLFQRVFHGGKNVELLNVHADYFGIIYGDDVIHEEF